MEIVDGCIITWLLVCGTWSLLMPLTYTEEMYTSPRPPYPRWAPVLVVALSLPSLVLGVIHLVRTVYGGE